MGRRILLVEDEERIARFVVRGLTFEGYKVDAASSAEEAWRHLSHREPDLVVLDLMLPDADGYDLCRRIRQTTNVPIVMLTARDAVADRVRGLDAGADDYLVKPFHLDELLARMRAVLRRSEPEAAERLAFADLEMSLVTREVRRGRRVMELTATEFGLLEFFLRHPRQVMEHERLLEGVWGYDFQGDRNVLHVYVRYLRQKTEEAGERRLLHTVRGVGYVLRED